MTGKIKQYFGLSSPKENPSKIDWTLEEVQRLKKTAIELHEIAEKEKLGHRLALLEAERLQAQVDYYKSLLEIHGVKYE